ncbi:DUF4252 domain-containing protein [Crocinitomix catalasitica]|nr:DUF4252 domain-containing protein [Crocinitomix catalasitica]
MTLVLACSVGFAQEINDFYSKHKNDVGMESKKIPPKMASLFVDEDYPEAIDILKSLTSLKYLNFWGDEKSIQKYAVEARANKGSYQFLLETSDKHRKVYVFGIKKGGKVKKIMAVVESNSQFLLIIARGKLSKKQIANIPILAKEIQ